MTARWQPITEPCAGPACDRPARAHGLCDSHYRQKRRYGRCFRLNRYQRAVIRASRAA